MSSVQRQHSLAIPDKYYMKFLCVCVCFTLCDDHCLVGFMAASFFQI